ncbi:MAG: ATP phosphoribosyltransferase [Spirochaetia bacterium]|nr:ATP phosphoribosyltransferase [Spirochaetia bacterium]
MQPFTFALPAGRLAEEAVAFFKACGLAEFPELSGRALTFTDKTGEFRVLLVRSQDVPTYVQHGGADAGIAGRDVLLEKEYDVTVPMELGFGRCRLSIAAPAAAGDQVLKRPHLRVATKYPKLTMDYFFKRGISCEIIKLHGSIEIAPLLGLSDVISDLVSTGGTLKANGLVELDTILESSAMLLLNRSVFALETARVNVILEKFEAALSKKT